MHFQSKPIVTMGDPNGIGPDLILIARKILGKDFNPLVIGSETCLKERAEQLGLPEYDGEIITPAGAPENFSENPGKSAFSYLNYAMNLLLSHKVGFLLTCPINKKAMNDAGFSYPGHTEYLAAKSGVSDFHMLMAGSKLKVLLATIHEPLRKVPDLITFDLIKNKIIAAAKSAFYDFGSEKPHIAVAGLNPHASENGMFGSEEADIILPAIKSAGKHLREIGINTEITGPLPPDTIFWEAVNFGYDIVLAMYHDQGLAAVKTLDFHNTVNVTLGLPFVRTSPDHGTACNLAGTGRINPDSFLAAWKTGLQIQHHRRVLQ